MGKKLRKSLRKAEKMSNKPIPGGYVTKQKLDDIKMSSSEIRKDLEATSRVEPDPTQFYRILTKITLQIQTIDKAARDLTEIFYGKH